MQKYKVVIIGAGIAGISASIYLKRSGINPLIIENNAPGGTLNFIPNVENYPGFESISGPDLAMNMYNQVNKLGIDIKFKDIKSIDLDNKIIDNEIDFDYLIIATGRRSKLLNIENEDKLLGRGISTCALCDGTFYKNKDVIVVGGGTSATSESIYLSNICKSVTIVHRRNKFTSEGSLIDKINNTDNIKVIYNSNIVKYNISDDRIVGVLLDNGKTIKTDGVFLAIGGTPNSELFDVNKNNGYIVVNDMFETNVDDVFAIGDVVEKDYYQLIGASNDGMTAALTIIDREKNK